MLADTPAAHAIGGLKVGVGFRFALQPCRDCLATRTKMKEKAAIYIYIHTYI